MTPNQAMTDSDRKMNVKLGVVTVLYNSDAVLGGFFASLAGQRNVDFTLYVIDNSEQATGSKLAEALAALHNISCDVVFNNCNVGVAKGNNQGIRRALQDKCTHILLANNDTEFEFDAFERLLEPLLTEGEVASTCRIAYFDDPEKLWFEYGDIYPIRALSPHLTCEVAAGEDRRYTPYAPTCFLMLSASVISMVGFMDEEYFVYYDDSDFVWRMRKANLRIRLIAQTMVLHKVSASTGGESSPFSLYYMHRNRIKFARKHNRFPTILFSLAYIYATRIYRISRMPKQKRYAAWKGLRDGLRA